MRIHVEVTQEDIDTPCDETKLRSQTCMIARAFERAATGRLAFDGVSVAPRRGYKGDWRVYVFHNLQQRYEADLPASAAQAARDWDEGEVEVQPFVFDLDLPDEASR